MGSYLRRTIRLARASNPSPPQNQRLGAPPPPPPPLGAGVGVIEVTVNCAALLVEEPTLFVTVTV
jgi:hypothetical protein